MQFNRSLCLGLVLVCLRGDNVARAQEAAPSPGQPASSQPATEAAIVAPTPRPAVRWVELEQLSFDLGFDAEWDRREVESELSDPARSTYRQTNRSRRFEETIGARIAGTLFDPRVLRFDLSGRWGLSQERFDETRPGVDLHTRPHGDLLEYDLRGTLLPAGKLTTQLFASQLDDRIPRAFLPSLDRRRERYGVEMTYADAKLPMRLRFEDVYEALDSRTRDLADDERRSETDFEYEVSWLPSDRQRLRLSYNYNDRNEEYSGSRSRFDTARNDLQLEHSLAFGPEDRSRLETLLRFEDETGDLARDATEVAPQLRLQHTRDLASLYKLQYLRESFEGVDQELFRGDLGLDSALGKDWRASANLFGLVTQADLGGDTSEWGGSAQLAFERENRAGRFRASLSYERTQLRSDDAQGDGVVLDEALTLRDPALAFLARQDAIATSLIVRSADRTRVYLAGRDYVVLPAGRNLALRRVRSGRIADGETVRLSYRYRTSQGLELSRDRIDLRIEQRFTSGLTPYYAGSVQFESIDRDRFVTYAPRDVNRHRVGLRYQQPRWSAGGEYEYNDDSIDPYDGLRVAADVVLLQRAPHALDARADVAYLDFRGENGLDPRDTLLFDCGLSYRLLLGQNLEATAAAAYRYEDDSLFGVTRGVDLSGGLEWKIGQFTALFEVEYDLLELSASKDGTLAAWIKIRRNIPLIGQR